MKQTPKKIGRLLLRITVCFFLTIGSPEGVVLCVGADGHAKLELACHKKSPDTKQCHHHCCSHCPHQSHSHGSGDQKDQSDKNQDMPGNQLQNDYIHLQSCVDIAVFTGYANFDNTDQTNELPIISVISLPTDDVTSCELSNYILSSHPPGAVHPSLLSLRTVILLT